MPTAQEIYDVLIRNPDYQEANGLTRKEVVEREAKRRARQHANNEKALSMAVQNSAVGKLSYYLQNMFLRKAFTDYDKNILLNIQQHRGLINALHSYLQSYYGGLDEDGYFTTGWKTFSGRGQEYQLADGISIFDFAPAAKNWHDLLRQLLTFSESVVNEKGELSTSPPNGNC